MEVLQQAGLKPYLHAKAMSGSVYIKFGSDVGGALRIADHPQRSRYAYRWNLRFDFNEITTKEKSHICFYYPIEDFETMLGDMIKECNLKTEGKRLMEELINV